MNAAALWLTGVIEAPIAALFYCGDRLRMATVLLVVTTVTHLMMHRLIIDAAGSVDTGILVGQIVATIVEATALWWFDPKRRPGLAMMASAVANVTSFLGGMALL